jgi:hypothetical protein
MRKGIEYESNRCGWEVRIKTVEEERDRKKHEYDEMINKF